MSLTHGLCQNDIIYFIITDRFAGVGDRQSREGGAVKDPRRYHGGNLDGIAEKIPYLKHLGVTALWITPVYLGIGNFLGADNYHGYWPLDFERVDPRLLKSTNGKEGLKKLVEVLHESGIKVILDMVVSHTGYHNETYRSYRGKKLPESWFKPAKAAALPFGLPALDHNLADVRDYFVNNIIDWIEDTGIDAIRLDSARHIDKAFWHYFKSYVRGKHRNVSFLGEVLDFDEESVAIYQREFDFDSLFDFPLCGNIVDVLIRNEEQKPPAQRRGMTAIAGPPSGSGQEIIGVLDTDWKYNNANRLVTLLDNHDLEKRLMSWALAYSGGDRMKAAALVKYVLTFQFTTRGIPQIYYGTEAGLEGEWSEGGDHFLRRKMPWEKIDPHTHEPFPVYRAEKMIYDYLRKLIALRREKEALTFGYLFTLHACFDLYAFMREYRGSTIIVVMNNSPDPTCRSLLVDIHDMTNVPARIKENLQKRKILVNVFARHEKVVCSEEGKIIFYVDGKEAKVFELV